MAEGGRDPHIPTVTFLDSTAGIETTAESITFQPQTENAPTIARLSYSDRPKEQIEREFKEKVRETKHNQHCEIKELREKVVKGGKRAVDLSKESSLRFISKLDKIAEQEEKITELKKECDVLTKNLQEAQKIGSQDVERLKKSLQEAQEQHQEQLNKLKRQFEEKLERERAKSFSFLVCLEAGDFRQRARLDKSRLQVVAGKIQRELKIYLEGIDASLTFIFEGSKVAKSGVMACIPDIRVKLESLFSDRLVGGIVWKRFVIEIPMIPDSALEIGHVIPIAWNGRTYEVTSKARVLEELEDRQLSTRRTAVSNRRRGSSPRSNRTALRDYARNLGSAEIHPSGGSSLMRTSSATSMRYETSLSQTSSSVPTRRTAVSNRWRGSSTRSNRTALWDFARTVGSAEIHPSGGSRSMRIRPLPSSSDNTSLSQTSSSESSDTEEEKERKKVTIGDVVYAVASFAGAVVAIANMKESTHVHVCPSCDHCCTHSHMCKVERRSFEIHGPRWDTHTCDYCDHICHHMHLCKDACIMM